MIFERDNKVPYIDNQRQFTNIPYDIDYLIVGHSFGGRIELAPEGCRKNSIFVKPEDIPQYQSKLLDELKKGIEQGFVYFGSNKKIVLDDIFNITFKNGSVIYFDQPFTLNPIVEAYTFEEVCKKELNKYNFMKEGLEMQRKHPEKSIVHCCIMAMGYKQIEDGKWVKE